MENEADRIARIKATSGNLANFASCDIGAWGRFTDASRPYAWAVLDHLGAFAISTVPAPATLGGAMGAVLSGLAIPLPLVLPETVRSMSRACVAAHSLR